MGVGTGERAVHGERLGELPELDGVWKAVVDHVVEDDEGVPRETARAYASGNVPAIARAVGWAANSKNRSFTFRKDSVVTFTVVPRVGKVGNLPGITDNHAGSTTREPAESCTAVPGNHAAGRQQRKGLKERD